MLIENKEIKKDYDIKIALAGNPNVGKSTLFNQLTGMHQHTGNWPGKTVKSAEGICTFNGKKIKFVDLPGTYSLRSSSAEEEIARDYICFSGCDRIVMVCDATKLESSLNICLQTLEMCNNVIVCVNFSDESAKSGIKINYELLSQTLKCPVIPICARKKKGLSDLLKLCISPELNPLFKIKYPKATESVIEEICDDLQNYDFSNINRRWIALKIIEGKTEITEKAEQNFNISLKNIIDKPRKSIQLSQEEVKSQQQFCTVLFAEYTVGKAVTANANANDKKSDFADKLLTGKFAGTLIMLLLLFAVFWLTLKGANYPSEILSRYLFELQYKIEELFTFIGIPSFITDIFVNGGIRVLFWVVSVMLPPMAIFFPLFTILENSGYLPRVAFNIDSHFQKAGTCGKQALTMCMGFGCNAAGVTGCRIINSPREQSVAAVTNCFMPCNGKFPALIATATVFFATDAFFGDIFAAVILIALVVFAVFITFRVSEMLCKTVFRGNASTFVLELPSFRKPQFAKIAIRSLFDRTLFVLLRAAAVAFPAGILIWVLSNVKFGGITLTQNIADFLNPFANLMGLDGAVLLAFVLGFPANETVIPIILMIYSRSGMLTDYTSLDALYKIFTANGWTACTAICFLVFTVFHWPCSTTLITVFKETRSLKKTALAFILPTAVGTVLCILTNMLYRIFF